LKKLNKGMSEGELAEFSEYLIAICGIGSPEKIAEYSEKFT
jgi:hypothetical protein